VGMHHGKEHSQEWLCHKGRGGWMASGWSAMFPASVAMFKSGHDPSVPQNRPGRKERAALGMTAGEKEREAESVWQPRSHFLSG